MSMQANASSKTRPRSRQRRSASRYRASDSARRPSAAARPAPIVDLACLDRRGAEAGCDDRFEVDRRLRDVPSPERGMGREHPLIRPIDARAQLGGLPVLDRRVGEPPRRQSGGPAGFPHVADEGPVGARPDQGCDLRQDVLDIVAPERGHERRIGEELDPVFGRRVIGQGLGEDRHGPVPLAEAVAGVAIRDGKTECPEALAHPTRKREALGGTLENGGGVDLALVDRPIVDAPQKGRDKASRPRQPLPGLDGSDPFLDATEVRERAALRDERVGQKRNEIRMLGDLERPVGSSRRPAGRLR